VEVGDGVGSVDGDVVGDGLGTIDGDLLGARVVGDWLGTDVDGA